MNIIILFFLMLFLAVFTYNFSRRRFLSPTFLSSIMFAIFSFEYYFFMNMIGSDISFQVVVVIFLSELAIGFGEFISEKFVIQQGNLKKEYENSNTVLKIDEMCVSISKTFFFFGFSIFVAAMRIFKLAQVYGGSSLLEIISGSRYSFARGEFSYGVVLALLYYVCQAVAYVYILLFMQSFFIQKKFSVYLLLPVIGYALCAMSTTSRTEFIKLACVFLTAFFICNIFHQKKKINFFKLGVLIIGFVIFFLWYGFSIRGVSYSGSLSILRSLVDYSCASLYGLDYFLKNPWSKNEYFGMYTLSNIYDLLGTGISLEYEPTYYMAVGKSNIYTSLNKPIQDYGIIGMLLTRMLLSFISVKIQKLCLCTNISKRLFYLLYIFVCHNVYIFLMAPIGDKAYLFYLNPKYIMELVVGLEIAFILGLNFEYRIGENLIQVKSMFTFRKRNYE